jgi:hypothetical protein
MGSGAAGARRAATAFADRIVAGVLPAGKNQIVSSLVAAFERLGYFVYPLIDRL